VESCSLRVYSPLDCFSLQDSEQRNKETAIILAATILATKILQQNEQYQIKVLQECGLCFLFHIKMKLMTANMCYW